MFTKFSKFAAAISAVVIGAMSIMVGPAAAVNKVYLKPDAANSAPCTVWGSPNNGMACGKTTAPATPIDVVGTVTATLFSGDLDTTKLTAGTISKVNIAAAAIDTTKLVPGATDTGKILCAKPDKSIGYCNSAIQTGTNPPRCDSCASL